MTGDRGGEPWAYGRGLADAFGKTRIELGESYRELPGSPSGTQRYFGGTGNSARSPAAPCAPHTVSSCRCIEAREVAGSARSPFCKHAA